MPRSDPVALTDRTQTAWTMRWEPAAEGVSCGGAPNTGVIVLSIPPTRVRALGITAGLPEADGQRLLQAETGQHVSLLDSGRGGIYRHAPEMAPRKLLDDEHRPSSPPLAAERSGPA